MKYFLRNLFCVLGLFVAAVVLTPKQVAAASSVDLKAGVTYKNYDITGDGKEDSIRIVDSPEEGDDSGSLKIYVNGNKAYTKNYKDEGGFVCAKLITLDNKKVFLYLDVEYVDIAYDPCALFYYKNGKLVMALDLANYPKNSFYLMDHFHFKSIKGNQITVHFYVVSGVLGCIEYDLTFRYTAKGNHLTLKSKTAANLKIGYDSSADMSKAGKKSYTVQKSKLKVYTSTGTKKVKFTVKKGKKVKILAMWTNGKKSCFKIKYGNRTGWIKNSDSYPSSGPLFKEAAYAG